jgi:hypothetical protein
MFVDTLLDIGFLAMDVADITCNGLNMENGLSLTADLLGLALPGLTGLGLGARGAFHGADIARQLDRFDDVQHLVSKSDNGLKEISRIADGVCSFSPDTEVTTPDGLRPISELREGDLVLAYDEATGTTGFYPVSAVLVHLDPTLVLLTIDGDRIETTPEHPFYTEAARWVPAGELRPGQRVRKADSSYGVVEAVAFAPRPQVMYNLTVAHAHTFFVGSVRVLVHNSCTNPVPLKGGASGLPEGVQWINPNDVDLMHPLDESKLSKVRNLLSEGYDPQHPITVSRKPNGRYIVWAGHHRLTVVKELGYDGIPATVKNFDLKANW